MPSSAPDVAAEVDVGERLRAIRALRRCTLKTVAERSGLSESFLSQVERGRSNASIASLRRIADALGVSVADLFEPTGPPAGRGCSAARTRRRSHFGVLGRKFLLTPRPLAAPRRSSSASSTPGGSTGDEPYAHGDSEELFVVLAGRRVQLELGGELHELEHGDCIDYRSSTPHRISNIGDEPAEVMWIISPPSY